MQGKGKKAELLADRLEIPADALGAPKLSICGRRRVLVENHCGILSYGDTVIELCCSDMKIRIRGDGLRLGAMDKKDMMISGRILSVELE